MVNYEIIMFGLFIFRRIMPCYNNYNITVKNVRHEIKFVVDIAQIYF